MIITVPMPELLALQHYAADPDRRDLLAVLDTTFATPSLSITATSPRGEQWLAEQGLAEEMALIGRMASIEELLVIVQRLLQTRLAFEVSQTMPSSDQVLLLVSDEKLDGYDRLRRADAVRRRRAIEQVRQEVNALWRTEREAQP